MREYKLNADPCKEATRKNNGDLNEKKIWSEIQCSFHK